MNTSGDKSSTYLFGALLLGAVLVGVGLVVLITSQQGNTESSTASADQAGSAANTAQNTEEDAARDLNAASETDDSTGTEGVELSLQELGLFDGRGEKACYVAINGAVYEISGSSLWQDGVHTIAGRDITCGKDLTEEMRGSPHGLSKLTSEYMKEIGKLK